MNRESPDQKSYVKAGGRLARINDLLGLMYMPYSFVHRDELDALCRIYRKLVSNCQYAAKTLASSSTSAAIAKPHSAVEVRQLG